MQPEEIEIIAFEWKCSENFREVICVLFWEKSFLHGLYPELLSGVKYKMNVLISIILFYLCAFVLFPTYLFIIYLFILNSNC